MHVFLVSAFHVFVKVFHRTACGIVLTKIQQTSEWELMKLEYTQAIVHLSQVMTIKRGVCDQKNTGQFRRSAK